MFSKSSGCTYPHQKVEVLGVNFPLYIVSIRIGLQDLQNDPEMQKLIGTHNRPAVYLNIVVIDLHSPYGIYIRKRMNMQRVRFI